MRRAAAGRAAEAVRCAGRRVLAGGLALAFAAGGCIEDADGDGAQTWVWELPEGFPEPSVPGDNQMSAAKVELGRRLFWDTRLSGNGTQSCASCHDPALAFTDGLVVSVGSTGQATPRNSMSLTNVAYNSTLTWAHDELLALEDQIPIPMFGTVPVELGITGAEDEILARLAADADYPAMFAAAFPEDPGEIDFDRVVKALSAFLRTMISGGSAYDRFAYQGDADALSDAQIRGLNLFFSEQLECFHCHGGFNFTQSTTHGGSGVLEKPFHNTGLYNVDGAGGYPASDPGLFAVTGDPADMGKFRAPTLRNIAVTAPYMHDGSIATLEAVVRTYAAGGRVIADGPNAGDGRLNPHKSGFIGGFTLTDEEIAGVVAFLESLTDEAFLADPRFADPFLELPVDPRPLP